MIQRAMLEVPQRFSGRSPVNPEVPAQLADWEGASGLAADVEAYGSKLGDMAQAEVGKLYPHPPSPYGGGDVLAWFWARAVQSPDPSWNGDVPLVGSWTLVKKPGRPTVWVEPVIENGHITYHVREGGNPIPGTIARGNGTCIATGAAIPNDYIKSEGMAGRLTQHLIAVAVQGARGRVYLSPTPADSEAAAVDARDCWRPTGAMSTHSQYMGTPRYGLDEWWKLFLPRQRLAIDAFCRSLDELREVILSDAARREMELGLPLASGGDGALAYSEAVTMYLAFVLDRAISRWNSLSIWHPLRETLEHLFRMQTIQMTWAFTEANPFSTATGGWSGQIDWVTKALLHLPMNSTATVAERDAGSTHRRGGEVRSLD